MAKTLTVAIREFKSTVLTKAFLLSIVFPILMYGLMAVFAIVFKDDTPTFDGRLAVIDRTGEAIPMLRLRFAPETMAAERRAQIEQATEMAREMLPPEVVEQYGQMLQPALERLLGETGKLEIIELNPATVDVDALKEQVKNQEYEALVDIGPGVLDPDSGDTVALFTQPTLHVELSGQLRAGIGRAIVDTRLLKRDLPIVETRKLMYPPNVSMVAVTEQGETKSNEALAFLVPLAFMMLLWISTFTGGQYLLTSTVEEKSSRVMELLLSAVSPIQLMTGKILGQGVVGLLMILVYGGAGVAAALKFGQAALVPPEKLALLGVYFLMAYFFVACLMAAIGSAVSDMREAQSLMGPAMLVLILPFMAMMPILQNPNGIVAVVGSFIPPLTPFVMALRIGSNQAIPFWQVGVTIVLGYAAVYIGVWATAKIFRIGVLMYGKPPNMITLLKWIRQA
jgi:ABC-2 type transport system permease protein